MAYSHSGKLHWDLLLCAIFKIGQNVLYNINSLISITVNYRLFGIISWYKTLFKVSGYRLRFGQNSVTQKFFALIVSW